MDEIQIFGGKFWYQGSSVTRWLVYFFSIENLPNSIRNLPKYVRNFAKYLMDPLTFAKIV